jgi:quercetin dioxygenase-like cupin family protein
MMKRCRITYWKRRSSNRRRRRLAHPGTAWVTKRPASRPRGGRRVMIVLPNWRARLNVENGMDASKFETELRTDGFGEIVKGEMKPNEIRNVHAHDYEVRGLVLDGEIVLTCDGEQRGFGVGEVFTMAAGREHAERAGSAGLRFIAGRRRQAG